MVPDVVVDRVDGQLNGGDQREVIAGNATIEALHPTRVACRRAAPAPWSLVPGFMATFRKKPAYHGKTARPRPNGTNSMLRSDLGFFKTQVGDQRLNAGSGAHYWKALLDT